MTVLQLKMAMLDKLKAIFDAEQIMVVDLDVCLEIIMKTHEELDKHRIKIVP